jgi:hypothetical protein
MNRFAKNVLSSLAVWCAALFLFSCSNKESTELKINFKKGDKYLYTTQVNQKISSFGMQMDQSMLMEMVYAYSGDEGANKKLDITYDHVMITMNSPMGQMKYDSKEQGQKDPEYAFMDNLIGKSFYITVAPNGDIVNVGGLSELIKSLPPATDNDVRASIESQLGDTAIKLMMQNSFDMYPGKAVKVGDSWSKKTITNYSGVNINVENTYTLKSISGNKADVGIVSVMSLPTVDSMNNGAPMQMEMNGKQEGTMEIDIPSGQILSGKTTQTIEGKLSANGQTIPMSISGDITISSKKL